jgi:hypothetical protein
VAAARSATLPVSWAYQPNSGLYPDTYIFGMRVGYGFAEHLPAVLGQ